MAPAKKTTTSAKKKAPTVKVEATKKSSSAKKKDNSTNQALAIVGLIINLILLPGLGSLIGGKIKEGVWQLVILFGSLIVGFLLLFTIVGIPLAILLFFAGPLAAWIWGLITGIKMIKESS